MKYLNQQRMEKEVEKTRQYLTSIGVADQDVHKYTNDYQLRDRKKPVQEDSSREKRTPKADRGSAEKGEVRQKKSKDAKETKEGRKDKVR